MFVCGSLVNSWQRIGLSMNEKDFSIAAAPGLGMMNGDIRGCTAEGY